MANVGLLLCNAWTSLESSPYHTFWAIWSSNISLDSNKFFMWSQSLPSRIHVDIWPDPECLTSCTVGLSREQENCPRASHVQMSCFAKFGQGPFCIWFYLLQLLTRCLGCSRARYEEGGNSLWFVFSCFAVQNTFNGRDSSNVQDQNQTLIQTLPLFGWQIAQQRCWTGVSIP